MSEERYRANAILIMIVLQIASISLIQLGLGAVLSKPGSTVDQQRIIVIPVYFPDCGPSTSIDTFIQRMSKVADYYTECSYSQVSITSDVLGWVELDSPMLSYAQTQTMGEVNHTPAQGRIFTEAIAKVDSQVNFLYYDRLILVHSGPGADAKNYSLIGTCNVPGWYATSDGRGFTKASIVSEYDEFGTIAHELGHDFGAPDLYDYYAKNADITGLYRWDIMSSGSYNGNPMGSMPAHMSTFTKLRTGWIHQNEIYNLSNGTLRINLVPLSVQGNGFRALRYDLPDGRYYLVESRSRVGFDQGLPGEGVLVMLVDESLIVRNRDAVRLQVPPFAEGLWNAELKEGESFSDSNSSFVVRVLKWTTDLATVVVGTDLRQDWAVCDRIGLPVGLDVNGVVVTTAHADAWLPATTTFAAVSLSNHTYSWFNVYSSNDSGRDWVLKFSTAGSGYGISMYRLTVTYYECNVIFAGWIGVLNSWQAGVLLYNLGSKTFGFSNLSLLVPGLFISSVAACASVDTYYMCCSGGLNGTRGLAYVRLRQAQWNYTWVPIPDVLDAKVSNPPTYNGIPYVLYQDGNKHLRLVRFNETSVLVSFDALYDGTRDFDLVSSPSRLLIAYHDGSENENKSN